MPRSLILEPTRELATQVAASFELYGKYHRLTMALLIGGESFVDQERKLDRGVDVLIATPGRLLDLYGRGKIILSDAHILVIDEADRMLDMGFIPDVERIVCLLPKSRQTLFFSATMPAEIRRLADAFLSNPVEISVAPPASPAVGVIQSLAVVDPRDKREALRRLIRSEDVKNALIFCNRKRDVDILYKSLARHGFDTAALHGDMPQPKRTETLERFKNGEIRLLVASDVAARGLDIKGMSHVFCFDVPDPCRGLRPPHRPHRPRRPVGPLVHAGGTRGRQGGRRDRKADRQGNSDDHGRRDRAGRTRIRGSSPAPAATAGPRRGWSARAEERRRKPPQTGRKQPPRRNQRETPRARVRTGGAIPAQRGPARIRRLRSSHDAGNVMRFPRTPEPRRRRPPERVAEPERRVVGFGDDLPAFLARPPRIVARP